MARRYFPSINGKLRVVPGSWYSSGSATPPTPPGSCDFTYCYGGDWAQGKVCNYSLGFPSLTTDGEVVVPTAPDISFAAADDFTVACWVKKKTAIVPGVGYAGYVSKLIPAQGWVLGTAAPDDKFVFHTRNGTNAFIEADSSNEDTDWHHLVAIRESGTSYLWVDGVQQTETSTEDMVDSGDDLVIGRWYSNSVDYHADAYIDEVGIWDVALTSTEISALYNSGAGARTDSFTPPIASTGSWATGKLDTYSLEFTGRYGLDYVSVPDNSSIQFGDSDDFTVACWVSSSTGDAWYQGFVSKKTNAGGNYAGWTLFRLNDDYMGVSIGSSPAPTPRGFVYTDEAPDDTWHHLVMTRNGTSKATALWLDGVEQTLNPLNSYTQPLTDSGTNMRLGQWWAPGTEYGLDGKLDEVGIWNVVLDSGAISDLYNSGAGAKANTVSSSALVDYYDMEDGPGSLTLTDQSSNTNNGTLTSMIAGTTGSLLLYYDFEIGDSNPDSGNFFALNNATSASVYDVTTAAFHPPTAHTGTMTQMSVADFGAWGQGKLGKYSFLADGIDDSIVIPSSSYFPLGDGNESFSISFWAFNNEVLGAPIHSYPTIVGRHTDTGEAWNDGYNIQWNTAGGPDTMRFSVGEYHNLGDHANVPWDMAIDLNFRHVVATYNKDTNVSQLWLDGVKGIDGVKATGSPGPKPATGPTRMGVLGISTSYSWPGGIDEMAFYNVVLDSGAISDLYNSGQGAKASTVSSSALVCYLDMECDGPGFTNVLDLSGNDLSGTLDADAGTCGAG